MVYKVPVEFALDFKMLEQNCNGGGRSDGTSAFTTTNWNNIYGNAFDNDFKATV